MKSTMVELVDELLKCEQTVHIEFIIDEARRGEYHDYKNLKYDCGKVELYRKLQFVGLLGLAERVKSGEFDEEPDADDIRNMREAVDEKHWKMLGLE